MKRHLSFIFIVALTFVFTGCASIVSKSTYPVAIQSRPAGATITVTDKKGRDIYIGNTPAIVYLKSSSGFFSKAEYAVKISLPGYQEHLTVINSSLDGWYFGNIVFGGLIGMLFIDPATGAMWTLDRESISVSLIPEEEKHTLEIRTIDQVPDKYKEYLVKIN